MYSILKLYFEEKFVRRRLDIVGNYIITEASSLYHIRKENRVHLSYSTSHKKGSLLLPSGKFQWIIYCLD